MVSTFSSPLRIAVVGVGAQGRTLARRFRSGDIAGAALAALVTSKSREAFPELDVPTVRTMADLVAADLADAVVVCVPHYEHPALAIDAIRLGLPVLVDKPLAVYSLQVTRLEEVARAHPDVPFGLIANYRAHPMWAEVKRRVAAGRIGDMRRSSFLATHYWRPKRYFEQAPWRATWGGEGGGVLVNQTAHQLDLWTWLCGTPTSVFANVRFGFRRDIAVEDEVNALVSFPGGATGVFTAATHELDGGDRLELLGDLGKVVITDSDHADIVSYIKPEKDISDEMSMELAAQIFLQQVPLTSLYTTERLESSLSLEGMLDAVLANFAAHVLHGEPLLAPGLEGGNSVRLANAMRLSGWTGREVPLDFDDAEYLDELNARIRAEGMYPERT
ncbi:MAG TPA: Gfo/Idh/MocA family oxidoreductase [Actinomycetaceae bacterium]|nr:Gfo/Idh/MocA family oxidoreductase [Actinomycetaceae bacterium]